MSSSCAPWVLVVLLAFAVAKMVVVDLTETVTIDNRPEYDLTTLQVPAVSGLALRILAALGETWPLNSLLLAKMKTDSEFSLPRLSLARPELVPLAPSFKPPLEAPTEQALEGPGDEFDLDSFATQIAPEDNGFRFWTAADYASAYRSGSVSPVSVAQRLLSAINASETDHEHPLRAFVKVNPETVLMEAAQSAQRYASNSPLSWLDGVPVAVKDEMDVKGFVTGGGTAFVDQPPAERDGTVVSKLRNAGAIILGKTNMHEIGAGVTGMNPHWGFARNPYGIHHATGGSSSGSGAAVAAGFVPLALGADGGGSVRIPSGLCGVFGLKPTTGRVSADGAFELCWSVGVVGPLAASARDLASAYMALAGPDERDPDTRDRPLPHVQGFDQIASFEGLTVGVYPTWNQDSDPQVLAAVNDFASALRERGATVVDITIPHLQLIARAHAITIISEMATAMGRYPEQKGNFGADVRLSLAVAHSFSPVDYIASQKVRTLAGNIMRDIFQRVDVILTPNTATTAPHIPEEAIPHGITDAAVLSQLMRFVVIPNFTGHPAVTAPVAYDSRGLPIAAQLIGRHFDEHLLLRFANLADSLLQGKRAKPRVFYDALSE